MAEAEVVVVGGGPAGAALAIHLATAGVDVALFERQPEPRWRAGGVYSSPLTRGRLAGLGLAAGTLEALIAPIEVMEVVSLRGPKVRLAHDHPFACGLDRVRLERTLLDRARQVGVRVFEGAAVRDLRPGARASAVVVAGAEVARHWRARIVVGADGPASLVARAVGVDRRALGPRHAGITQHRADPDDPDIVAAATAAATSGVTARMFLGPGWYCGVAPVPGGRVNVGIVMNEAMLRRHLARGARPVGIVDDVLAGLPPPAERWRDARGTDTVQVALPLAHRVARAAGPGFLLVGDAAGFLDPLSGEGLHRALVSAELAAAAILATRAGDPAALERYARHMRARFRAKDIVSWLLQVFLARPELADHALRRMAARDGIRDTFGRVLADQLSATRVLDPRFLAGLLRP